MKKHLKKWTFRLGVTFLFIAGLLCIIILNPVLTYANRTTHNNYSVYHNKPLDPTLTTRLDEVTALLKKSEFYNPDLKLDICINDGSKYPAVIKALRGQAFGWGFYNKVVLLGEANSSANYVEFHGYRWNLSQLLTHEAVHCLQYKKLGLWRSKPLKNIPEWKWEGYPEYIARQLRDQRDLKMNIRNLNEADEKDSNEWAIYFTDNTIAPKAYYKYWLMVQYCIDVKKMTYDAILKDTTREETLKTQMMDWYEEK